MKFHLSKKISLIFLIMAFATIMFTACGQGDSIVGDINGGDEADAVFVIMKNTAVAADDKDFLNLINIDGQTFDTAYDLTFSVEEGKEFISFTGTDGVIETGDVSGKETAIVTANHEGKTTRIKVVVLGGYNPVDFANSDNAIIPYGVSEIDAAYKGSKIKYVRIPGSISYIPTSAFAECKNLESVEMPNFLSSIGSGAFMDCEKLTSITFPTELSTIGENAFRNCGFETVSLPESLNQIDGFAFSTCRNLKEFTMPSKVVKLENKTFQNCENLVTIELNEGLSIIGDSVFSGCKSLKNITIPETVKEIKERAFSHCEALESIEIPNSVKKMGESAFYACKAITSVTIPNTLGILKDAFYDVTSVEYVHLTGHGMGYDYTSENYIYTPWYQSRLNDITVDIDEGITTIGEYQFVKCDGLVKINLPSTITSIRHGAFRKCYNLSEINVPEGVKVIERYAFSLCYNLENIEIPNTVRVIENNAFEGCRALKEIIVPNSVYRIEQMAFASCVALEKVTLGTDSGSLLRSIGNGAFKGTLLKCKEVRINSTRVKHIGYMAFGYDQKIDFSNRNIDVINKGMFAMDSVIKVKTGDILRKFIPNSNYNESTTKVIVG